MMTGMLRSLLLALSLLACAGAAQAGDRRYAVADFDRVLVEGAYDVRLTVGGPSSAQASGSAQALDAVTVEVQGTTLRIRRNRSAWGGQPGRAPTPATIILTTRNLRSAQVIGSGTLDISGARGLQLSFLVQGNGQLRASRLDADNLGLVLRGSGAFRLEGAAKALKAVVEGAGSIDGTGLSTDTATIAAATSGDISLNARRSATVDAKGLGRVTVAGAAACTLRGPRAGEVSCGNPR